VCGADGLQKLKQTEGCPVLKARTVRYTFNGNVKQRHGPGRSPKKQAAATNSKATSTAKSEGAGPALRDPPLCV